MSNEKQLTPIERAIEKVKGHPEWDASNVVLMLGGLLAEEKETMRTIFKAHQTFRPSDWTKACHHADSFEQYYFSQYNKTK